MEPVHVQDAGHLSAAVSGGADDDPRRGWCDGAQFRGTVGLLPTLPPRWGQNGGDQVIRDDADLVYVSLLDEFLVRAGDLLPASPRRVGGTGPTAVAPHLRGGQLPVVQQRPVGFVDPAMGEVLDLRSAGLAQRGFAPGERHREHIVVVRGRRWCDADRGGRFRGHDVRRLERHRPPRPHGNRPLPGPPGGGSGEDIVGNDDTGVP